MEQLDVVRNFKKYVGRNILGMIGMSAYLLADTFFISLCAGADGLTALNLVLPLYSLIFAVGHMLGVGFATRFTIDRARGDVGAERYFANALWTCFLISIPYMAAGLFVPDRLMVLFGGDPGIVAVGTPYTRIFMLFTPFFMWNCVFNAFVRNDGAPSLSMVATLVSSLFNIVMDYVLMFPLKMGMAGAALATVFSPIVGCSICMLHVAKRRNVLSMKFALPKFKLLFNACKLGISSFVSEMSSGVSITVFNFVILSLAGNPGVAAFGIVSNIAILVTSVFSGISQGSQPLMSYSHGKGNPTDVGRLLRLAIVWALVSAILMAAVALIFPEQLVDVFNKEGNEAMAYYAVPGVQLYFLGYIFAGINIVGTGYLAATEKSVWAFWASICRGLIMIVPCTFIMSALFGMTGVWLSFLAAEALTFIVVLVGIKRSKGANS